MRGNELRFCLLHFPGNLVKDKRFLCLLIFPHQACRGRLEDKEIFCFQLNFPGNLEDKSVCMGNEGNTGFTFPLRTMKIEVIMVLQFVNTLRAPRACCKF